MEGVGDGPPPEDRLAVLVEDRSGQWLERAESSQRVDPEAERLDFQLQWVGQILRVDIERRGDVRRDHLADRLRGRGLANQAERFSGESLDDRRDIPERLDERADCGLVTDQSQRKRGHLTYLGLGIGEGSHERLHTLGEPHAPYRHGGAPS